MALKYHLPISGVPKPAKKDDYPTYWDQVCEWEKKYFAEQKKLGKDRKTGVYVSPPNYWGHRLLVEIKKGIIVRVEYRTTQTEGNLSENDVLEASDKHGFMKAHDEKYFRWDTPSVDYPMF
jgi:hypothetical protein